jgi:cytochrome c oxidase subunit 3
MSGKWRHYFNDIPQAGVAQSIGSVIGILFFFFIFFLKKSLFFYVLPLLLLFVLILCIVSWFTEMLTESSLMGRYGRKLRAAFCCGFILFLCSEIMLFGGFFWAYFDRLFDISYELAGYLLPSDLIMIESIVWPLVGTVILITSGYFVNQSYYLLRVGEYASHLLFGYVAILLAASFLLIQVLEYNESYFTISCSIYGSFFYLLTGFHGFHVTVGFLFLVEQYERIIGGVYSNDHYFYQPAFEAHELRILRKYDVSRLYEHSDWPLVDETVPLFKIKRKLAVLPAGAFLFVFNFHAERLRNGVIKLLYYRHFIVRGNLECSTQLYNRQRNTGITAAIIYWHFVDIIWIFLFFCVYIFPNVN